MFTIMLCICVLVGFTIHRKVPPAVKWVLDLVLGKAKYTGCVSLTTNRTGGNFECPHLQWETQLVLL